MGLIDHTHLRPLLSGGDPELSEPHQVFVSESALACKARTGKSDPGLIRLVARSGRSQLPEGLWASVLTLPSLQFPPELGRSCSLACGLSGECLA